MFSKDSSVIIVGGGAWGLSTALHMHSAGYTNVTVFERAEQIPSPYSAAYDLNKIVRAEYEVSLTAPNVEVVHAFGSCLLRKGYIG